VTLDMTEAVVLSAQVGAAISRVCKTAQTLDAVVRYARRAFDMFPIRS